MLTQSVDWRCSLGLQWRVLGRFSSGGRLTIIGVRCSLNPQHDGPYDDAEVEDADERKCDYASDCSREQRAIVICCTEPGDNSRSSILSNRWTMCESTLARRLV